MSPQIDPADSRSSKLSRATLGRQVQDQLRSDILFGRLEAGTALQQEKLCERFGTSRMPVRDALASLVFEGFAERTSTGKIVVVSLGPEDLTDVLRAEGMLHGIAVRRVTLGGLPAHLQELEGLIQAMTAAVEIHDARSMSQLNHQFHRRINQMAGSPKLMAALRAVSLHVDRQFLLENPDWMTRSNAQHAAIFSAMHSGCPDEAESQMFEHVLESGTEMVRTLPIYAGERKQPAR